MGGRHKRGYVQPKHVCSSCGNIRKAAINDNGNFICANCYYKNYKWQTDICSCCGNVAPIYSRTTDGVICKKCYEPPKHLCSQCGNFAPTAKHIDGGGGICNTCYSKKIKRICSACGKLRRISVSLQGMSICDQCHQKSRYREDEKFRVICMLRSRLYEAMNTYSKCGKVKHSDEYGVNYKAIAEHLGPCPGNRGDYHIDHIIPLVAFDFNDPEQIKKAFAPENHRWLKCQENLSKNSKYDEADLAAFLKG